MLFPYIDLSTRKQFIRRTWLIFFNFLKICECEYRWEAILYEKLSYWDLSFSHIFILTNFLGKTIKIKHLIWWITVFQKLDDQAVYLNAPEKNWGAFCAKKVVRSGAWVFTDKLFLHNWKLRYLPLWLACYPKNCDYSGKEQCLFKMWLLKTIKLMLLFSRHLQLLGKDF